MPESRWLRILLGPLPATVLPLTLVFAGGLGEAIALVTSLFESDHLTAERWANLNSAALLLSWLTAAGVGMVALWVAVLHRPATLKRSSKHLWVAAGPFVGLLVAVR